MKSTLNWLLVLLLTGSMLAQANSPASAVPAAKPRTRRAGKAATKPAEPSTADQIRQLREMMQQQQQQLNALQQQMQQRDQQLEQAQQQLQQAQQAASEAQAKATAAQTAAEAQKQSLTQVQSDVADVQTTLTNSANETQEQQKKVSEISSLLDRFRFTGDIRVRQEDFFQGCNTFPGCNPRVRERVRLRLGVEGRLGQDFLGGMAIASGAVTDPTSTNETLSNVFERKNVSFDRGYIVYQPQAHKWLQLWGGKWAYTWARTSATFDPDLNPEGFSQKLSFELKGPVLKNVNLTGIQMLFNEDKNLHDSFAAGFQFGTKLQFGPRISVAPAFTLLNWRNTDVVLNEPSSVTGSASTVFAPNGMTNCTQTIAGKNYFCSQFLYADFLLPVTVKTPWAKLPFYVNGEYEQNLRAATSLVTGTPQDKDYGVDVGFGQQKEKGDTQFGYEFRRQEQDSVIASFNESDQRAPTNILQHRLYVLYKFRNNVQGAYTLWVGRTLNTNLPNAAKAPGILAGQTDPWLKRMQFDLIYSF